MPESNENQSTENLVKVKIKVSFEIEGFAESMDAYLQWTRSMWYIQGIQIDPNYVEDSMNFLVRSVTQVDEELAPREGE